jgi:hypothetical protein
VKRACAHLWRVDLERRDVLSARSRGIVREENQMTDFPTVRHVALTVTDLEVSRSWYERLTGLKPVLVEHVPAVRATGATPTPSSPYRTGSSWPFTPTALRTRTIPLMSSDPGLITSALLARIEMKSSGGKSGWRNSGSRRRHCRGRQRIRPLFPRSRRSCPRVLGALTATVPRKRLEVLAATPPGGDAISSRGDPCLNAMCAIRLRSNSRPALRHLR